MSFLTVIFTACIGISGTF